MSHDEKSLDRRAFLIRSAKAGITLAGAAALSYLLYDPIGPPRGTQDSSLSLPDFSIPETAGRLSIVTGTDRVETVNLGLKALGGIEAFVKKGERVLIKVNAAFATPPSLGATTNPELVSEVVRLCLKAGASAVLVTDNPINDPESCFVLTGIGQAAQSAGGRLVLPRESLFKPVTVPGATHLRNWPVLYDPFEGVDRVIGLAPLKDHHRSGASMTMKNWYGIVGGRRNIFHQDIHGFIMELAMMVKPTLVILDGITAMVSNGPTGGSLSDLRQTNTMILSTDQVAADAVGAVVLGRSMSDLPFILRAEAAGAGTSDFESLNPIRVSTG
jgi:uncharacterized protein (DUF362 family)